MYIQIEAEAKKLAKSEGNSKGAEEPTWELFQNFSCVFKLENIIIAERLNCFRNVPVKPVPVPGSDLKPGEWMGGSMAASGDNLYVCAFLQVPDFCALFWFSLIFLNFSFKLNIN